MKFLSGFIIFFVMQNAFAMELKELSISGTGCEKQNINQIKPIKGDDYKFPFIFSISKQDVSQLERKACLLALPVKLNKKEKLQVSNINQNVTLNAFGGAHVKLSLTVTAPGQSGSKPLEVEVKNPTSLDQDLKQDGIIFETKCGADAIVRANINAFIQGPGTASASAGDLFLTLKSVPCR